MKVVESDAGGSGLLWQVGRSFAPAKWVEVADRAVTGGPYQGLRALLVKRFPNPSVGREPHTRKPTNEHGTHG